MLKILSLSNMFMIKIGTTLETRDASGYHREGGLSSYNSGLVIVFYKKDYNQISDKGTRYLSKTVWRNLKVLNLGNIQLM